MQYHNGIKPFAKDSLHIVLKVLNPARLPLEKRDIFTSVSYPTLVYRSLQGRVWVSTGAKALGVTYETERI